MNRAEGSSLRLVAALAWTVLVIVPPRIAAACATDAECDDGNSCTVNETCDSGACQPGTAKSNGSACNDGNACTITDRCVSGVCVGTVQPDGVACSDGNSCTIGETCQGGTCTGSPVLDDTPCEDGNTCTVGDTCQGGMCSGGAVRGDGEFCVDGDPCTGPDACQAGVCVSGPRAAFDQDGDGDCDVKEEACGCDETDPGEICHLPNRLVGRGQSLYAEVLMEWHTPTTRKVHADADESCATAGKCSLDIDGAMRCTKGKIRDACTVDSDCDQPANTCRLIVNWADRPNLALIYARRNRDDLPQFNAVAPACSTKVDVSLDATHRTNRVRLRAIGTANGRIRRERDSFRYYPVRP